MAVVAAAAGFASFSYLYLTLPDVRPLVRTNPTTTAFMEMRGREKRGDGKSVRRAHRWVPYSRISPHLKRAVLVAEDDAFFEHDGIDITQIRKSIETDLARGRAVQRGQHHYAAAREESLFIALS